MSKLFFVVMLVVGLVLIASMAVAANAVREMEGIKNEIKGIDREIKGLKAKLPGLGELQRKRDEEYEQITKKHDEIHKDFSRKLEAYKSECLGRPLLGDHYRNCKSKQERLQGIKNVNEARLRLLVKRGREIERQYQETSNEITLIGARIQKITNYKSLLEERLKSLRKHIIERCSDVYANASDEEIKLKCGNVQFDGANPNLPTGDGLQPQPGGITITPNK